MNIHITLRLSRTPAARQRLDSSSRSGAELLQPPSVLHATVSSADPRLAVLHHDHPQCVRLKGLLDPGRRETLQLDYQDCHLNQLLRRRHPSYDYQKESGHRTQGAPPKTDFPDVRMSRTRFPAGTEAVNWQRTHGGIQPPDTPPVPFVYRHHLQTSSLPAASGPISCGEACAHT